MQVSRIKQYLAYSKQKMSFFHCALILGFSHVNNDFSVSLKNQYLQRIKNSSRSADKIIPVLSFQSFKTFSYCIIIYCWPQHHKIVSKDYHLSIERLPVSSKYELSTQFIEVRQTNNWEIFLNTGAAQSQELDYQSSTKKIFYFPK